MYLYLMCIQKSRVHEFAICVLYHSRHPRGGVTQCVTLGGGSRSMATYQSPRLVGGALAAQSRLIRTSSSMVETARGTLLVLVPWSYHTGMTRQQHQHRDLGQPPTPTELRCLILEEESLTTKWVCMDWLYSFSLGMEVIVPVTSYFNAYSYAHPMYVSFVHYQLVAVYSYSLEEDRRYILMPPTTQIPQSAIPTHNLTGKPCLLSLLPSLSHLSCLPSSLSLSFFASLSPYTVHAWKGIQKLSSIYSVAGVCIQGIWTLWSSALRYFTDWPPTELSPNWIV